MAYYILDNTEIIDIQNEFNPEYFPQLQALTGEMLDFYIANPTATLEEVRNLKLNQRNDLMSLPTSSLEDSKKAIISEMSSYSLHISEQIVPDYKIRNAQISLLNVGNPIYTAEEANQVLARANEVGKFCRDLFYQFKALITEASSQDEIDRIYNDTQFEYDNLVNNEKTT